MNLGFIGTGRITEAVVTGICLSSIKYKRIFISNRNSKILYKSGPYLVILIANKKP